MTDYRVQIQCYSTNTRNDWGGSHLVVKNAKCSKRKNIRRKGNV